MQKGRCFNLYFRDGEWRGGFYLIEKNEEGRGGGSMFQISEIVVKGFAV